MMIATVIITKLLQTLHRKTHQSLFITVSPQGVEGYIKVNQKHRTVEWKKELKNTFTMS